jgi:hypothetical protein
MLVNAKVEKRYEKTTRKQHIINAEEEIKTL